MCGKQWQTQFEIVVEMQFKNITHLADLYILLFSFVSYMYKCIFVFCFSFSFRPYDVEC